MVQSATRPVFVAQPRRSLVSEKVRTLMPFDTQTHTSVRTLSQIWFINNALNLVRKGPPVLSLNLASSVNEKLILDMGDDAASMGKLIEKRPPLHNHCLS